MVIRLKEESITKGISFSFVTQTSGKAVGLIRHSLMAYFFGASIGIDFFNIANGVILVFFPLLAEGFEYFATPIAVRYLKESRRRFDNYFWAILVTAFLLAAAVLAVFLVVINPVLSLFAGGYSAGQLAGVRQYTLYMLPVAFLYLPYGAMTALFRSFHSYSIPLFAEFLITLVAAAMLAVYHQTPIALCVSLSVAHVAGFLYLFLLALRHFSLHLDGCWLSDALRDGGRFVSMLHKLIFINSVHIIFVIAEKNYGTFLGTGTLAIMTYALVFNSALITLPNFAKIFFPVLSAQCDNEMLDKAVKTTFLYSIFVIVFFWGSAEPFLGLFIGHGRMNPQDLARVALVFKILNLQLLFEFPAQIFYRLYYLKGKARWCALNRLGANIGAAIGLFLMYKARFGVQGLAYFYCLRILFVFALDMFFVRSIGFIISMETVRFMSKLSLCGLISFVITWQLGLMLSDNTSVITLFLSGVVYSGCFFTCFWIGCNDSFSVLVRGKIASALQGSWPIRRPA